MARLKVLKACTGAVALIQRFGLSLNEESVFACAGYWCENVNASTCTQSNRWAILCECKKRCAFGVLLWFQRAFG